MLGACPNRKLLYECDYFYKDFGNADSSYQGEKNKSGTNNSAKDTTFVVVDQTLPFSQK
jgi:hypothetical protein